MALHPEAVEFFRTLHEGGGPPIHEMTPVEARAMAAGLGEAIGAGPAVEHVANFTIPVAGGEIAARRWEPAGARGTILWLHGGGWVIDGLEHCDAECRILANASGAAVVAVDYRVAPEHPVQVPVDDCWAALQHVADSLDADGRPLVVGGDSAGGNLAAVCALRAREAGGPPLAAQVLVYPVVDHDMTTRSYLEHGANEELLLDTKSMRWFFDHYVADGAARDDPEVSPLRAPDLSNLPPATLVVAEYDPLRDEGLAYAERLRDAGVEVTVHRYEEMPHGFFSFVNLFPTGNDAVAKIGMELRYLIARRAAAAA